MHKVTLKDGLTIGKSTYNALYLDVLTAGDAIDAAGASERIQFAGNGEAVIINSPARATAERIRRQVKRIEGPDCDAMQGPMTLGDLRKLSEGDYRRVTQMADFVDGLYMKREAGNDAPGGQDQERFPGSSPDQPDT